jgi:hypothetical protein
MSAKSRTRELAAPRLGAHRIAKVDIDLELHARVRNPGIHHDSDTRIQCRISDNHCPHRLREKSHPIVRIWQVRNFHNDGGDRLRVARDPQGESISVAGRTSRTGMPPFKTNFPAYSDIDIRASQRSTT